MTKEKEWLTASVDLSNDVTTILATPALVGGFVVTSALSAHDCQIKDGSTTKIVIPASSPIGYSGTMSEGGWRFDTSLIVDPDNAATGTITIAYLDLRAPR